MRALLSTIGSRGDVQSLAALALQLRARGSAARTAGPSLRTLQLADTTPSRQPYARLDCPDAGAGDLRDFRIAVTVAAPQPQRAAQRRWQTIDRACETRAPLIHQGHVLR